MVTYELAQIGLSGNAIEFCCTVTDEAKPVLAELQQRTGARVRCIGWHFGDEVQWLVERCRGKEVYAMWWLLRHLCVRGREPNASYTDAKEGTRHLLRRGRFEVATEDLDLPRVEQSQHPRQLPRAQMPVHASGHIPS